MGAKDKQSEIVMNGQLNIDAMRVGGGAVITAMYSTLSNTIDPPELAPSETWYQDLFVPTANVGDIVVVSFSQSTQTLMISATVIDTNTVRVMLFNPGAGGLTVDVAPGIFRI